MTWFEDKVEQMKGNPEFIAEQLRIENGELKAQIAVLVEALSFIDDQRNKGKAGNWAVELAGHTLSNFPAEAAKVQAVLDAAKEWGLSEGWVGENSEIAPCPVDDCPICDLGLAVRAWRDTK